MPSADWRCRQILANTSRNATCHTSPHLHLVGLPARARTRTLTRMSKSRRCGLQTREEKQPGRSRNIDMNVLRRVPSPSHPTDPATWDTQ
jgi:hypothetical protein